MPDSGRPRNMPGSTQKYRASCDSCHEAKVRCSQTRPTCARCVKHGSHCVYGISQRAGKHSAEAYNARRRNAVVAVGPPTPLASTDAGTPTSTNAIDLTDLLLPSPVASDHAANSSDFSGQQLRQWTLDNLFMPDDPLASQLVHADFSYQRTFEGENGQTRGFPQQQSRSFSCQQPDGMMQAARHGTTQTPPLPTPCASTGRPSSVLEAELGSYCQERQGDNHYSLAASPPCVSCTADAQDEHLILDGNCRCNETVITAMSSLPVLLRNERRAFDAELVQLQAAIKLCTKVLACTCLDKDYTAILTISVLLGRILAVFERCSDGACRDDNDMSVDGHEGGDASRSPKFSFGAYQINGDDELKLKQEIWWMQLRKVESIVADFKDTTSRVEQGQAYQGIVQAAVWEKLFLLLEQKIQAVKRDWVEARGKL